MDTATISPNFDDIRPLNNDEVKDAIESLIANQDFERALRYIKPQLDWQPCEPVKRKSSSKRHWPTMP